MPSTFFDKLKVTSKMADIISGVENKLFTWMEGSAQCGKSVTAALAFAALIENSPPEDILFLALGYTSTSIKNNVSFCGGFGLEGYFGNKARKGKYYGSDALFIETKTGTKTVFFTGGRTQTANNAWHGWPVAAAIVDEIDRIHPNSIEELKQRIQAKPNAHIIVTQNPNFEKHPIYKELEGFQKQDDVDYYHFILDDNPALTKDELIKIKNRYDPSSIYYKRYVLGLRVNPEGLLYEVKDHNKLDQIDFKNYNRYITVVDIGESASSTTFLMGTPYFDKDLNQWQLHIVREWNHINNKVNELQKKSSLQYIDDYIIFIKECIELMDGKHPEKILFDGTEQFFRDLRNGLRREKLGQHTPKRVVKDKEEERIYKGQSWLYQGKLKFYKECKLTIQDFNSAENDDKIYQSTGKIVTKEEFNIDGHLDRLDACNYIMTYYTYLIK